MLPKTRSASVRGPSITGALEEIRRAFSDALARKSHEPDQPKVAHSSQFRSSGAIPESANTRVQALLTSGLDVEDLVDRGRSITNEVSVVKPGEITVPSCQDVCAVLARFDAAYDSKVDLLTYQLAQLQTGQHDVRMLAVELESAIGSFTTDIYALGQSVTTLELAPNPLSHILRDPLRVNKVGAVHAAPQYNAAFSFNVPPNIDGRNHAPFPSIILQIPIDPRFAGSQAAPNNGAPQLITTTTSSAQIRRK